MFELCAMERPGAVRIKLHVHPGAKRNAVNGVFGESVKIDLQTPPVDGKANAALLKFMAKLFGLSRSDLAITSGECSRDKVLEVKNIDKNTILTILNKSTL